MFQATEASWDMAAEMSIVETLYLVAYHAQTRLPVLLCVGWQVVAGISKDLSAFVYKVK